MEPGADSNAPVPIARRDSIYRRVLLAADVAAAIAAVFLTRLLVGPYPAIGTLLAVPLMLVMSKVIGIYDREESLVRKSTLDEAPALFSLATVYTLVVWLINSPITSRTGARREFLVVNWALVFLSLLVCRTAARWLSRWVTDAERCLIVGDRSACEPLQTKMGRSGSLHANAVGLVTIDDVLNDQRGIAGHHGYGLSVDPGRPDGDLRALTSYLGVDRIIIAPASVDAEEVLNLIRAATSLGLKVSVVPRVLEVVGSSVEFDDVEGVPLLSMRRVRLGRSSRIVKRCLDLVVSVVVLAALLPLFVGIALAIKLDSPGPVLFRQRRVGRDGQLFEMLKFRTMVQDADSQKENLRDLNEAVGLFKIDHDPRITRVGALLRRVSFDELPQLLNVVRGDMSLVGPRPLVAEEDRRIHGWHRRRLQLTPGMTGHWQILGSARIPLEEMVKIDYLYVTNWSLWNDMKILLRTIPYVIGGKGM